MEPARARDARPLRRHGEDLVRHGDAVEEQQRPGDRLDLPDCFARGRWLVAVEASADEPDTRVSDRREGWRHAGRAAAAHVPQSVIKNALAVLVFPKKHGHLALIADPADLHVAVVCGADGVVAGPRALVGAQRAALVGAPVPVQIKQPRERSARGQEPAARTLGFLVELVAVAS